MAMHLPRVLLLVLAALALTTAGSLVTVRGSDAQRNAGTFHAFVEALNADDAVGVQAHLADDFTLTFVGGTTLTGTEAVHLLMLLDTPITAVSVTPGGMQKGTAVVEFGGVPPQYTINYTGVRGGRFASWTIEVPTTPHEHDE